jgi:hypothetical protein
MGVVTKNQSIHNRLEGIVRSPGLTWIWDLRQASAGLSTHVALANRR